MTQRPKPRPRERPRRSGAQIVGVCNLKIFQAASSVSTSSANCLKKNYQRDYSILQRIQANWFLHCFPVDDPRNLSPFLIAEKAPSWLLLGNTRISAFSWTGHVLVGALPGQLRQRWCWVPQSLLHCSPSFQDTSSGQNCTCGMPECTWSMRKVSKRKRMPRKWSRSWVADCQTLRDKITVKTIQDQEKMWNVETRPDIESPSTLPKPLTVHHSPPDWWDGPQLSEIRSQREGCRVHVEQCCPNWGKKPAVIHQMKALTTKRKRHDWQVMSEMSASELS